MDQPTEGNRIEQVASGTTQTIFSLDNSGGLLRSKPGITSINSYAGGWRTIKPIPGSPILKGEP